MIIPESFYTYNNNMYYLEKLSSGRIYKLNHYTEQFKPFLLSFLICGAGSNKWGEVPLQILEE